MEYFFGFSFGISNEGITGVNIADRMQRRKKGKKQGEGEGEGMSIQLRSRRRKRRESYEGQWRI